MALIRTMSLCAVLALASVGCSSANKGTLTVTGQEPRQLLAQSFDHAFIRSSQAGEYDVVMFQEGDGAAKSGPGWMSWGKSAWAAVWPWAKKEGLEPIKPLGEAEFRQVVHVHVLWQANGGSVAKDGVLTNAAIDWYVIGHSSPGSAAELIRYQGAGYVILDEGNRSTTVDIRDGLMRKTDATGELNDPIGPARLVGKVSAQPNREAVANVLAELKAQMVGSKPVVTLAR